MHTTVTFRQMGTSDALKGHAEEKTKRMTKYFDEAAEAHVVLSLERYLHKAEVTIFAHGIVMHGKEESSDMYNSLDRAMEKIEKQVKRYRDRIVRLRPKTGAKLKMRYQVLETLPETEQNTELPPTIIETKEFHASHMMLDEAVMQMDLLHSDILVFLNVKTGHLNVLYRKNGNKYGLIETDAHGAP